MKADTAVTTIYPTSNYDIIDLTGDEPNTTNEYVGQVSVHSSVVVELIDDPPVPAVVHIPIPVSRQDIPADSIGNSAHMQEKSRNSSLVETNVLRRCKSTLELFAEVTRGVIISSNNSRTLLQHSRIKVHRSEEGLVANDGRIVANDDDGIQYEQQRCVRCLESLLIASAFETKTAAYDRRINETSVRALIKKAYR